MENILSSETSLSQELSLVTKHSALLSSLKLLFPSSHSPHLDHLHKRATLSNIQLCQPTTTTTTPTPTPTTAPITLTLKSTKPQLSFTLSCNPTSTISSLKSQLYLQFSLTAPLPEQQRWILKGKAMGDNKLLLEFDSAKDGTTVNLMIKPPSDPIPSLTLSTPSSSTPTKPPLAISTDSILPIPVTSALSSPTLWTSLLSLLETHFIKSAPEDEDAAKRKAREIWESWFDASLNAGEEITPSEKAKIREVVGVSVMGGV